MVSDEGIIRMVENADDPFTTASEVAEQAGFARQTAYKHLQRLYEQDRIKKKKIGSSAVIWWVDSRVR